MRFRRTKRTVPVAAAAMLTVIGIGAAGLANGAPANTSLSPGQSTNITRCTTSLSLSANRSPAVLRCAVRVDNDDDFAADDNLIVYDYDVIYDHDDHHARDDHDDHPAVGWGALYESVLLHQRPGGHYQYGRRG